MTKGKIIIFNGVSSSGKSTLAKTLQNRLRDIYFRIDIDMFPKKELDFDMFDKFAKILPERFEHRLFSPDYTDSNSVLSTFYSIIKMFSDLGLNVVVDGGFFKDAMPLDNCLCLLHDYPVLFVHVTCPLDELRRREKERGDRGIGAGEAQLLILEPQDIYDITVDTFNETKEECADRIIELLEHTEKHTAFKTLWAQYSN